MPIKRSPPKGGLFHGCRFGLSDEAVCKVSRKQGFSVTSNWKFVTCKGCQDGKRTFQKKKGNPHLRTPY